LPLPITRIESKPQSLQDVLRQHFEPEHVDDYICDRCKKEGAVRSMKISRCPNYMIIDLKRAQFGQKLHTQVNFPLDKLDMRPYFVDLAGIDPARLPREWVPPFMYECYAIIQHKGETVNSGHYWALIRDFKDPNVWWRMNDDNAGLVQAYGPPDGYNTQTKQSYILFYRRSK
jgi:ubiquitin carboxyl-terminal hydrolase 8